jgi:hypothetical protein
MNTSSRYRSLIAWLVLLVIAAPIARAQERQLFQGRQVPPPNERLYTQTQRTLTVVTAVPSAEETEAIFGADLYAKNIQPVWVQVENRGDDTLFLTPLSLDPGYYNPRESAFRLREGATDGISSESLERKAITRLRVPPQSIQSGYIFSQVDEGTKSFNVDVIGGGEPYLMSFFVPVPGLKLDHYEIDIPGMYDESELKRVDLPGLVAELERLPCCVRDENGHDRGDPLNLVFVGEIKDMYYAFMRAGWDETETIYGASLMKTAASALSGGRYRYSPVSALYVFGRPQDVALQRARTSINERNHLRVWLTPLRLEGEPVWIGQISRDIGVHFTWRTITTHKIDPDVDETREFLVEDMAYAQALAKFGYVGGVGPAPYDQPRGNLTGDPYFTDGRRVVMWISGKQTAIDEIEVLDLSPYHTGHVSD